MDCQNAQSWIDGYLDHELDPLRSLEIEDHLRVCSLCSERYHAHQALSENLRKESLYFKAPGELHSRIQRSVRQAAGSPARRLSWSWRWAPMAAAALIVLALLPLLRGPSTQEILTQEVLSSHIRSLMPEHLTDVASSDQHTVKPWFNGRLDFSPPVTDFAKEGFPLVGGRLDYINNRAVAVLVYGRRKHFINVFVWPSASHPDGAAETITLQGYNLFHWTKAGMTYWAASDLNSSELQEFVQLVQSQT
ncbi:MAG TPA: anti-sigma factor [Blastocatellia bacterium]|nr:anti-sigma factor [Blastocatellia bacterium]